MGLLLGDGHASEPERLDKPHGTIGCELKIIRFSVNETSHLITQFQLTDSIGHTITLKLSLTLRVKLTKFIVLKHDKDHEDELTCEIRYLRDFAP